MYNKLCYLKLKNKIHVKRRRIKRKRKRKWKQKAKAKADQMVAAKLKYNLFKKPKTILCLLVSLLLFFCLSFALFKFYWYWKEKRRLFTVTHSNRDYSINTLVPPLSATSLWFIKYFFFLQFVFNLYLIVTLLRKIIRL